ncbi:hypothetical protein LSO2F_100021 [Candidatus Liberibacter solanacearum]
MTNFEAAMFTKPRFGKRLYKGICPPSKPRTLTPDLDFCPLTPLPAVFPVPEPIPRATRFLALRDPLSQLISFNFILPQTLIIFIQQYEQDDEQRESFHE